MGVFFVPFHLSSPVSSSAPMALLRKYIWLLVIVMMIFVSTIIGLIFLFINKWISRRAGKHSIAHLQKGSDFKVESNKYHERNIEGCATPPLPPRTQFLTTIEAQSYENLAETPNFEESVPDNEESAHDYEESEHDYEETTEPQPEYLKLDDEVGAFPSTPAYNDSGANMKSGASLGESYENLAEENDYEETTDQQPDYLKLDDEETGAFPAPPAFNDPGANMNLVEENDYEQSTDDQPDYVEVEGDEEPFLPADPSDPAADNISNDDYDDIGSEHQDEEDYDDVG